MFGGPPVTERLLIDRVDALCAGVQEAQYPVDVLDAVGAAVTRLFGPGLLTMNAWHASLLQIERLWTSDPVAYPVGGRKSKPDSPWRRQLLERAEVFVGEGDAALAAVFDDVEAIRALGCTAVVNVPLCHRGKVIGTLNFLAQRTAWQPAEIAALRMLGLVATTAVRELVAARS